VRRAVGERRFGYVSRQLGAAFEAYDRERWRDAAKLLNPLLEELFLVREVREIAGRVEYKLQHWRAAAEHLEFARASNPTDMTNMPVLIDCYRALKRYEVVNQLWEEMKLVSPHPMVMAEGRVSAAMSYADQGDVQTAIRIMTHGSEPTNVQPHHVLEWYVLGDLHDRAGDPVSAKRYFVKVAKADAEFYDVAARLASLGD
jgi:tetratricopeptide (TPR) repeat protein